MNNQYKDIRGIVHSSDTYIVMDLEWNQPIRYLKSKMDPKLLPGEIIEIGAVKLTIEPSGIRLSSLFHVRIRPVCYTIMNKNVGRIIGKMSADLKAGLPFGEGYDAFMNWCGTDYVLCGWGNSDLEILRSNLRFHGRPTRIGAHFLDLQIFFARVAEGKSSQRSVEYAVDYLGLSKHEDFHKAHLDAEYSGRILKALFAKIEPDPRKHSVFRSGTGGHSQIKNTTERKKTDLKKWHIAHYLYDPDLSTKSERRTENYDSWMKCCQETAKEEALCPVCQEKLIPEIPWFRIRKNAFALLRCPQHNQIAGRIRMKKTAQGEIYASIVLRWVQPGEAKQMYERFEEYTQYGSEGKPFVPKAADPPSERG